MTLPISYPYKPRPYVIVLNLFAGAAWIGINGLSCHCVVQGTGLWFGLVPLALGIVTAFQRFVSDRRLVLELDTFVVPSGPLRLRSTRLRYVDIERVWETRLPLCVVLSVKTRVGKFEVVSSMLPGWDDYSAVANFLHSFRKTP